jgi:hypothetical protein
MNIDPPDVFVRLCHDYYKISPERLLCALAYEFSLHPPLELILIEHAMVREESSARERAA